MTTLFMSETETLETLPSVESTETIADETLIPKKKK